MTTDGDRQIVDSCLDDGLAIELGTPDREKAKASGMFPTSTSLNS